MNRKLLVVIIIVAVVAGSVYLAFPTLQGLLAGKNNEEIAVEYVQVERGTLSSAVSATGSVEPRAETVLTFETSGRIVELFVKENDKKYSIFFLFVTGI